MNMKEKLMLIFFEIICLKVEELVPVILTCLLSQKNCSSFLTELSLGALVILVAEKSSSKEWHIAFWSGSCPDLKAEDYDHGILCAIGQYKKDSVNAQASK